MAEQIQLMVNLLEPDNRRSTKGTNVKLWSTSTQTNQMTAWDKATIRGIFLADGTLVQIVRILGNGGIVVNRNRMGCPPIVQRKPTLDE